MGENEPWTCSVAAYMEAIDRPGDVLRHQLLLPAFLSFAGPVTGLRILDIGCGAGTLLEMLLDRGAVVAGLDNSEEMLERAAARAPGAWLCRHDLAEPLPSGFSRREFDGITANLALHCLSEIADLPRRLAPALRAGGWLAFSILHPAFHQSPEQIQALKRLGPAERTWAFGVDLPYLTPRSYQKTVARSDVAVRNWHRPIRDYVRALRDGGFAITDLDEPLLAGPLGQEPAWFHAAMIPRFLFVRAQLQ